MKNMLKHIQINIQEYYMFNELLISDKKKNSKNMCEKNGLYKKLILNMHEFLV